MEPLRSYLNSLPLHDQRLFAERCGTSIGYLRKAICINQLLSESLTIAIERESCGAVTVEELRPDVPWYVIRGRPSPKSKDAAA